jgi:hypothetical protein
MVDVKRKRRMAQVDSYPLAVRELVHEYGLTVVKTIYDLVVKKPEHIKHIVETVLNEFSPTRGSFSAQGIRTVHEDRSERRGASPLKPGRGATGQPPATDLVLGTPKAAGAGCEPNPYAGLPPRLHPNSNG